MKKKLPDWYVVVWYLLLTLFVCFNFIYYVGGQGIRFIRSGAKVSFDRQYDYQLYKIDEKNAFLGMKDAEYVFAVDYAQAPVPFCYLCGFYESKGNVKDKGLFRQPDGSEPTRTYVDANFPKLSTMNESCLTFNAAFLLLFALWTLIFPIAWLKRK